MHGIALLAGFYVVMILCQAGIIQLFAATRNLGPQVNRVMVGISAIALVCFGIYELWSGLGAFWRT